MLTFEIFRSVAALCGITAIAALCIVFRHRLRKKIKGSGGNPCHV